MPKPNYSEQNPDDWLDAFIKSLNELNKKYNLEEVALLLFSGQTHGLVILDENDRVIRNALLWNDSRTINEVDYLNNVIGKEKLIEETANVALCSFTAPKVLWIKNNEPENFKRIKKIMLSKDYLAYRLTDTFASDISDLSGTLFFSSKNRDYSNFMLDVLKVSRDQLPKIYDSYEVIGTVTPKMSKLTNLPTSCKVVIGGGEQALGATGTSTLRDNDMLISLGTSGVVLSSTDNYFFDKECRVNSFRHANGKHLLMGCTLGASMSLTWFLEKILETSDYNKECSNLPKEITDIIFLPYLMGERNPINDPNAKGIFSNLNAFYTRKDMIKALIEGVCFSLYDCYLVMKELGVKPSFIRVIGGMSKSNDVVQILADIFNIKMKLISTKDGGSLGAIILAMVGDNAYKNVYEASEDPVKDVKEFIPNEANHEIYLKKFKLYKETYLKNKA